MLRHHACTTWSRSEEGRSRRVSIWVYMCTQILDKKSSKIVQLSRLERGTDNSMVLGSNPRDCFFFWIWKKSKITGSSIHNTRVQPMHPVVSPRSISVQNWPLTTDHSRHLLIKWPLNTDRLTSKKCTIQYGDHIHDHENIRVRVRVRGQNPWSTQQKKCERTSL